MLSISLKTITTILAGIVITLFVLNFVAISLKYIVTDDYYLTEFIDSFQRLFLLNGEANIPAWYSSLLLFSSALLLAMITSLERIARGKRVWEWSALTLIFVYLSCDESAMIHEMAIKPLRTVLDKQGLFYSTWAIFAIPLVFVFVLIYLRFLASLDAKIRRRFLASGAIYVSGAIGIEILAGFFLELYGTENIMYLVSFSFEELFEMVGIVVFINTLLLHLSLNFKEIRVSIETGPPYLSKSKENTATEKTYR